VAAAVHAARRTDGLVDPTLVTEIEAAGYAGDLPRSALPAKGRRHLPRRRPARPDPRARWREIAVDRTHATVLCSATLTVQHRFDYIASRLGIRIEAEPDDDSFRALRNARTAVSRDLRTRAATLAGLRTWSLPLSLPALVLAQRLYRDPDRADQLIAQAAPPHPLFMPADFTALAV